MARLHFIVLAPVDPTFTLPGPQAIEEIYFSRFTRCFDCWLRHLNTTADRLPPGVAIMF
jgi:hypothetical protein